MNELHVSPTIVITTKHKTISVKSILLILIALTGCICTFSVCFSMVHLEYNKILFWFITFLSVLSTSILSMMPKRLNLIGFIPPVLGGMFVFFKFDNVVSGAKLFYNFYYCAVHNTETQFFEIENALSIDNDISWFLCCISIILCSLISRTLVRRTYFILYFLLTFIPIEFGLYEGLKMNIPSMFILVTTWFCVLALQLASQHGKKLNSGNSNIANCGIAMLVFTIISVIVSVVLCNLLNLTTDKDIQSKRVKFREDIENFRWEDIANNIADIGISLGLINDPDLRKLGTKNKLEYRNEDEIQITLSELPDQSLYLKNFTGSVYEKNSWSIISDEKWNENENLKTLFNRFECVPQILPFMINQSIYDASNNAIIEIKPLNKSEPVLLPYASYGQNCVYSYDTGCAMKSDDNEYRYTISLKQNFYNIASMSINHYYLPTSGFNFNDNTTTTFFGQLNINTSSESIDISAIRAPYMDDSKYKTQALQASLAENYAYRQFVYENYVDPFYSEDLNEVYASLPSELYKASQSGNTLEILGAIRRYLANTSKYTMSPGETPSTRDFVNYFLLENNKGYCMHFATAGTILARYFGVPARYCEGYIVSSDTMSEGTKNEDGSVVINIPDSSAHAWCEYYIDGYGWVPYELTPGYYDLTAETNQTDYIEENPTEAQNIDTETQTETYIETTTVVTTEITNNNDVDSKGASSISSENSSENSFNSSFKVIIYIIVSIILLIFIIMIFILARNYVLNKRNCNFRNSDTVIGIISIYKFLMVLLKYQSITPENIQLLDFAKNAEEKLNKLGFNGNGSADIIRFALAADMGGKAPSREEIDASIRYVNSLSYSFGENKNIFTRLIMKYIYHFF